MNLNLQTITEIELLQAALIGLEKQRSLIAGETFADELKLDRQYREPRRRSAATRRRMAEAQQKRWAKIHRARKGSR